MAKHKSYLEQRRELKLKGKKPEPVERHEKVIKAEFFAQALKEAPTHCQNCGKSLAGTMAINPAAIVAHILAKARVPSVATHPLNRVFLDGDCHTDMDNKGCDYIKKMKIFELMRRRVVLMWSEIPAHERRKVPECLKPTQ